MRSQARCNTKRGHRVCVLYLLPQSLHPNLNHEGARRMQRALAAGLGASATDEEVVDCEQARRSTPAERISRVEAALAALTPAAESAAADAARRSRAYSDFSAQLEDDEVDMAATSPEPEAPAGDKPRRGLISTGLFFEILASVELTG